MIFLMRLITVVIKYSSLVVKRNIVLTLIKKNIYFVIDWFELHFLEMSLIVEMGAKYIE